MGYKCGIVGLPNVGKSSLANLLARSNKAKVGNFPFCTIDPNELEAQYLDDSLLKVSQITQSKKTLYSSLKIVDIAGLVRGASKGEGLGNQFLSHIREVDAIYHVVRCFEDKNTAHVMNECNPISDWELIKLELSIADLDTIQKMKIKNRDKDKALLLDKIEKALHSGEMLNIEDSTLQFLSFKPMIAVLNGEEDDILVAKMKSYCTDKNIDYVVFPIVDLNEDTPVEIYINKLIEKGLGILNLISFFTTGPEETRSWTILNGTKAVDAAGVIHSSFSKHFIAAEVTSYDNFLTGKVNHELKGRDYIVNNRDIMNFRHNAR